MPDPYASPANVPDNVPSADRQLWRQGESLVVRSGVSDFPLRCLRCGSSLNTRKIGYNLRCKPKLWMLLLPYVAPFRPSVRARPALCTKHMRAEKASRWLGHFIFIVAATMLIAPYTLLAKLNDGTAAPELALLLPVGTLVLLVWVYYRTFRYKAVCASAIRGDVARIDDVPAGFVDGLPEVRRN